MKADYTLRYAAGGLSGSFWAEQVDLDQRPQLAAIASLGGNAAGLTWIETPINQMFGSARSVVENISVSYVEGDVAIITPELLDFWRVELNTTRNQILHIRYKPLPASGEPYRLKIAESSFVVTASGEYLDEDETFTPYNGEQAVYLVPVPQYLTPLVIAGKDGRVLVSGVDFDVEKNFIALRESPGDVLGAGSFTVLSALQDCQKPFLFPYHIDGNPFGTRWIVDYFRLGRSTASFGRAAAQAAGMLVLQEEDQVVFCTELNTGGFRYVFAVMGVVEVTYPHTRLTEGQVYPKGLIVSDSFEVVEPTPYNDRWIAEERYRGSFSLDGVLAVKGLLMPTENVLVDYVEVDAAGVPFARIHLPGDADALQAFWDIQKHHETRTGHRLAIELSISAQFPARYIDFAQLLHNYYGTQIIVLHRSELCDSQRQRLDDFIDRERPAGVVILQ